MTFQKPKKHLAISIDGGGMKGLMVAQALVALEKELVGDNPLNTCPELKILTGTSTGSIISGCIAMGLRAQEIVDLYVNASKNVFPPLDPAWFPRWLKIVTMLIRGLIFPSQYRNKGFVDLLREYIGKYLGNPDATMADLNKVLKDRNQSVIITANEIGDRRTHFLKTYDEADGNWELWRAILASSSAPTIFPVVTRPEEADHYFTDGGVGAQGNPAYIAAQEAVEWCGFDSADVTLLSFGTGWFNRETYLNSAGRPDKWRLPDWAMNAPNIIIQDVARSQSIDVIYYYVENGMDFRRFQVRLDSDFDPFASSEDSNRRMVEIGKMLGERILNNQHALADPTGSHPDFDPEGLVTLYKKYVNSRRRAQARGASMK